MAGTSADTTVTVSSTQVAPFGKYMLGGNLSPWGTFWPDSTFNPTLKDMGIGLMRVGHAEKYYVDMEAWYPTKGGTPNWDAGGSLGSGKTFNQQIAWWKSLNMPIEYTLSDELSTAMLNADGTINYAEVARAWSLHIKHLIDSGVNLQYVEIGNECDIAPQEGIEYPPVEQSRGGQSGTGRFIDPKVTPASANEYIKLFNAVYPAIKAVAPNVKISAYPSGQGPVTTLYFPYDYLFSQNQYKPDFLPIHVYPFSNTSTPVQRVEDATWSYSGNYYTDWDGKIGNLHDLLASYGASGTEIGITEFDYDSMTKYTNANAMWDAVFYASAMTNAANAGVQHTAFWDTFAGSNTDSLITDTYTNPTPGLKSQGLAMRLMKQFNTPGRVVLSSSVSSTDNAAPYDWSNQPIPIQAGTGKRVESLATRDASGTKVLLINKNASLAHTVHLSIDGVTSSQATVELYSSRAALSSQTPTTTTVALSGGALDVQLPKMSMAVVTIATGSTPPPPPPPADTTPPAVTLNAPAAGAVVTGPTTLTAMASDAGSGVARVDFLVDGQVVGSDSAAPYSVTWDATGASPGSHTIQARAVDGAGNVGTALITVSVPAPPPADTAPPTVKITAPAPGSATVGAVTISADASDSGSGVARVEFRVDGQLVGTDASAPYTTSWSAPAGSGPVVNGPIVSFSFDDSNVGEYTDDFPILRAAGYPGTLFVTTNEIDQYSDKLTLAQLTQMRDAGWEISSHTSDHWTNLPSNPTTADYEGPIAAGKQWLDSHGFPNSGFAAPNGTDNATIQAIVRKYHPYDRCSWGPQTLPVANPYQLCASPIDYQPLTALTADLDTIQSNGGWAIYLDHAWEAPTIFQQLVTEVQRRGIQVKTVRDVVVGSAQAGPHTIEVTAYDNAGNSAKDTIVVNNATTPPPPADTTPPAPVASFTAKPTNSVSLSWVLPTDPDLACVRVLRSTQSFASSAATSASEALIYEGTASSFVDHPTTSAITYYTAFARDAAGNWSTAATVKQDPTTKITAPGSITTALSAAVTVRVRLVDLSGNGLNGKTVTLRRQDGVTLTMTPVTTAGTPDGTYSATLKRLNRRQTQLTVSYAGDAFFKPSSAIVYLTAK